MFNVGRNVGMAGTARPMGQKPHIIISYSEQSLHSLRANSLSSKPLFARNAIQIALRTSVARLPNETIEFVHDVANAVLADVPRTLWPTILGLASSWL